MHKTYYYIKDINKTKTKALTFLALIETFATGHGCNFLLNDYALNQRGKMYTLSGKRQAICCKHPVYY